MEKINITTVSGVATSATAVPVVIPEHQKSKAVIRRFSALGNDADCAVKFYIPKLARSFNLLENLASDGTKVKIPVDVAGGHKFKGHTLTANDKLLLLTPTGWKVVGASYADVGGKPYCEATITAVGAIAANTRAYILVPGKDVVDGLPAIGNAAVTVEDFISGDAGAPVLFDLVAAASKSVTAAALVEYWF